MASGIGTDATRTAEAVDEGRLWQSLMDMAKFGASEGGGVTRHALSPEDIAARAAYIGWAQKQGYAVSVDDAANLFVRRPGSDAEASPVIAGSHLDSQPSGGKFDGAYGVLAAFEALRALDDAGVSTRRPIDVVAWTNEEGGRFERSCTGSSVWSGAATLEECLDDVGFDGVRLGDALAETLAATPDLPRRPRQWKASAYVEPHIEQGPMLEREGLEIAAVTGIQGVRWMNVEIKGQAGHAGTTPLRLRKDAMQAAHRAISALNALMDDPDDVVRFTVGRMLVSPNSPSVVPDRVLFTIDFRHPDPDVLSTRGGAIPLLINQAVAPCEVTITPTLTMDPVTFPSAVPDLVSRTAQSLGLGCRGLPSGAFHDALYVARVCPAGMIFIPCRNGLSHHPAEWAEPAHCAAGARVLAASLVELANG